MVVTRSMPLPNDSISNESLLMSEIVIPEQIIPEPRIFGSMGEKKLMFALLEQAIYDILDGFYAEPSSVRSRHASLAIRYVLADDMKYSHSFLNACHAIGFDPEYIRRGLQEFADGKLSSSRSQELTRGKVIPLQIAAEESRKFKIHSLHKKRSKIRVHNIM